MQGGWRMPNKTIYVSDADLPIFERAQQLAGGNLSATIAQALRRFVESQDAKTEGLREITVKVGSVAYMQKRFVGRLLARGRDEIPPPATCGGVFSRRQRPPPSKPRLRVPICGISEQGCYRTAASAWPSAGLAGRLD